MPLQEGKRAATTLERWQQVHELRARNAGLLECARRVNLSLNTVKRYDRVIYVRLTDAHDLAHGH